MDRPLSHDDIVELLGAYALDAVGPDEAAAVNEHLAGCPRCRAEVASHRQTAAVLASSLGDVPAGPHGDAPAGLWDGIAARLDRPAGTPEPPRPGGPSPGGTARPARAGWAPSRLARAAVAVVAVAAAVAIALLGVQVVHLNHRLDRVAAGTAAQSVSQAGRLALLDPGSRRIVLTSSGAGSQVLAEVVIDGSGTAFLFNRGLPALRPVRTYQLWLTAGARPVSLGLLGSNPGTVAFAIGPNRAANAFAVSDEAARGSTTPTLPPVAASAA
jgi:hypothetical protein